MEPTIKLELTIDDVNNSLAGVSNLPYNVAAPLIAKIRDQAIPQVPQEPGTVEEATTSEPQLLTEQK